MYSFRNVKGVRQQAPAGESQLLANINALHLVLTEEGSIAAAITLHRLSNLSSEETNAMVCFCQNASVRRLCSLSYIHIAHDS